MKRQWVLFCVLFLVACSPVLSQVSTPIITVSPTLEVISTRTVVIPATARPTVEPAPTSVRIPARYDNLPVWLSDAQATVAVMISDVDGQVYKLSFLNLATSATYDLSVSPDVVRGYFWTPDAKQFGFLAADLKSISLVNLASGNVEQHVISEKTSRFLNDEKIGIIEPLIVQGVFEPDDFSLISQGSQSDFSVNLKYRIREDYQTAASPFLLVENLETGEVTQITDPLDGWYDYGSSWSPRVSHLAVVESTEFGLRMIPSGEKITIYKFNGEKLTSFDGAFKRPVWSTDGSSLLYKETTSNSPCILEISTGIRHCIREIERIHTDAYDVALFNWSAKGDKLYYIYSTDIGTVKSGICIYNLVSGVDFCPTTNLTAL